MKVGDKFDLWTVVGPAVDSGRGDGSKSFPCRCDCGTERLVTFKSLGKQVRSCGCLRNAALKERATIDGRSLRPGYKRLKWLQEQYGLSGDDWDRMFDEQQGRCLICEVEFAGTKVCVDHDHETGVVRGLLCHHCNVGLGHFKDDVNLLRRAIEYLGD